MKKLLLVITMCLIASSASATILWDQSTPAADPGESYMDSESAGMWGTVIVFGASDFHLGSDSEITSVTTLYNDNGAGFWEPGNYTALLDIWAKTGATPVTGTDDPYTTGTTVAVTLTSNGDGTMSLTASGLSISLAAGDYWIMLSPAIADGPSGRCNHRGAAAPYGDLSAWIEFGGWMTPSWASGSYDGTLLIEGTSVVANDEQSWGSVKSLFR